MYVPKAGYRIPSDRNIKIWRYMDFTKFVSLLNDKALYFAPPTRLGDPFEGSLGKRNLVSLLDDEGNFLKGMGTNEMLARTQDALNLVRYFQYMIKCKVNCWHMNEQESAAMWKLYVRSGEGIAIQSTFNRFCRALDASNELNVHIGKVSYIDHFDPVRGKVPNNPLESPLLYKRKSYEHERELRALCVVKPKGERSIGSERPEELKQSSIRTIQDAIEGKLGLSEDESQSEIQRVLRLVLKGDFAKAEKTLNNADQIPGQSVPINLETLIENVYISPDSPPWLATLISSLLTTFGLNQTTVIHSDLNSPAMF